MQRRWMFRGVTTAGLVLGLCLPASAQMKLSPVAVSEVVEREIPGGQTFVGTIMPLRKSVIGSAVDGRVIEFPVNQGERVTAGQALAQLRTDTLKIELAAAKAERELRQQQLEELTNGSLPEEIEQARARMAAAGALIEYTRARHKRTQTLFDRGTVTEDVLQEALSASVQAEESYREAKAAYDLAVAGPRQERIAQAAANVAAQDEEVRRLEDHIVKHTIVSPFDGYVITEHTEVGAWVNRGELVAEVVDLHQVDIVIHVGQEYISQMRVGMPCSVQVNGIQAQPFEGRVAHIVPQADLRARAFPVLVRVDNPLHDDGHLLKAGMLAQVSAAIGHQQQATLVPKDALVLGGQQTMVFVVAADPKNPRQGTVRPVAVTLGVADEALIQAAGQLKPGDQVVVQGNERLRPGDTVQITRVLEPGAAPSARSARQ